MRILHTRQRTNTILKRQFRNTSCTKPVWNTILSKWQEYSVYIESHLVKLTGSKGRTISSLIPYFSLNACKGNPHKQHQEPLLVSSVVQTNTCIASLNVHFHNSSLSKREYVESFWLVPISISDCTVHWPECKQAFLKIYFRGKKKKISRSSKGHL